MTLRQITFCDDDPIPGVGSITFCDGTPKPSEGSITFCEQDQSNPLCKDISALTLTGSEAPSNGDYYRVSGGLPPYRMEVTGGATLTASGSGATIGNVSGLSGVGVVSVRDSCGQTAEIEVRYPLGSWVETDYYCNPGCNVYTNNCQAIINQCGWGVTFIKTCTSYVGKNRFDYGYILSSDSGGTPSLCGLAPENCVPDISCDYGSGNNARSRIFEKTTYEWQ